MLVPATLDGIDDWMATDQLHVFGTSGAKGWFNVDRNQIPLETRPNDGNLRALVCQGRPVAQGADQPFGIAGSVWRTLLHVGRGAVQALQAHTTDGLCCSPSSRPSP